MCATPRLASLGWGYVHLCRDAPDLSEAVARFVLWLYPQARFARLSVICISVEMLTTSSGPSPPALYVVIRLLRVIVITPSHASIGNLSRNKKKEVYTQLGITNKTVNQNQYTTVKLQIAHMSNGRCPFV